MSAMPLVLITVEGGVAEVESYPPDIMVKVRHIDFDNLDAGHAELDDIFELMYATTDLLNVGAFARAKQMNEHAGRYLADYVQRRG